MVKGYYINIDKSAEHYFQLYMYIVDEWFDLRGEG